MASESTKERAPARLFVIPARDADVAVVFRRGPSRWYHVLKWDLANDTIEPGAWLRGRIYEERCDLSPDGTLLLSFVHQGRKLGSGYTDAWSAVSRLPWLQALGLWPQGTTYGGGGRFLSNRRVVLRGMSRPPHPDHPGEHLEVEFGPAPLQASSGEVPGAHWSGRDRHGRLIHATDGCLFRRDADGTDHQLIDLNGLVPDPQAPPAWATAPLIAPRPQERR